MQTRTKSTDRTAAEHQPRPALESAIDAIAGSEWLDHATSVLDAAHAAIPTSWTATLRGRQVGHAVHPVLTDLPIGFWTSASVLDLVGGARAAPAARRLVGLGVLSAVPTLLSGLAEYGTITDQDERRIAAAHAVANDLALGMYMLSWRSRRSHRLRGALWSLAGATVATGAGMLGGHLAFALGVGTSAESGHDPSGSVADVDPLSQRHGPGGGDAGDGTDDTVLGPVDGILSDVEPGPAGPIA